MRKSKLVRYRTVILGILALAMLIYGLVVILEVPSREVAILFFVACLFVAAMALLGFLISFFISKIRRWFKSLG